MFGFFIWRKTNSHVYTNLVAVAGPRESDQKWQCLHAINVRTKADQLNSLANSVQTICTNKIHRNLN